MKILGRQDRAMTDKEFLAFVKAMSRELKEIADERKMVGLAQALDGVYRMVNPARERQEVVEL